MGIDHTDNRFSHLWLGSPVYPVLDLLGCPFFFKEALLCQNAQEDATLVQAECFDACWEGVICWTVAMSHCQSVYHRANYGADVGLLVDPGDPAHVVVSHGGVVLIGSIGQVIESLFQGTAQKLGDGT